MKKNALIDEVVKNGIFGKVVAAVHVVEFQVSQGSRQLSFASIFRNAGSRTFT